MDTWEAIDAAKAEIYSTDDVNEQRTTAALLLHQHIRGCETCSGPLDGCDLGQWLEGVCVYDLIFDPHERCCPCGGDPSDDCYCADDAD